MLYNSTGSQERSRLLIYSTKPAATEANTDTSYLDIDKNGMTFDYTVGGTHNYWYLHAEDPGLFYDMHSGSNYRPYLYNGKAIGAGETDKLFIGSYEIDTTNYTHLLIDKDVLHFSYLQNGGLQLERNLYWYNNWHSGRYVINLGQLQSYITPIPINNLSGGGACLLLWSIHWSDGNNTGCGIILIRTGYNGNHLEINSLHEMGLNTGETYNSYFGLYNNNGYIEVGTKSSTGAGRFCFYHCM